MMPTWEASPEMHVSPDGVREDRAQTNSERSQPRQKAPEATSRIGLIVFAGIGNLGNDATLAVMARMTRRLRPGAEIVAICGDPRVVSRDLQIPSVPIVWPSPGSLIYRIANRLSLRILGHAYSWYRTLTYLRGFDAVIIPGTGILDDFGVTPMGMPYRLFMWCVSARARRVPLAFVSVGAGPINHWASRFFMLGAARLARYRSYRDVTSAEFARAHAIETGRDSVYPDLVFGASFSEVKQVSARASRPQKVIGIGVMNYRGWSDRADKGQEIHRRYVGELAKLIDKLGRRGYGICLLVGVQDEMLVGKLTEKLREAADGPLTPKLDVRLAQTLAQHAAHIGETDLVIATRYHTVIAALALAVPVISLGYAKKFDAVMADFGLERYCNTAETLDVNGVIDQVEELCANLGVTQSRLAAKLTTVRERLARQEAQLDALILPKPAQP